MERIKINNFIEHNLIKAKEGRKIIDNLWIKADEIDSEEFADEVAQKAELFEKEMIGAVSIYILGDLLLGHIPKEKTDLFDVSKIYISKEQDKIFRAYDIELLDIIYGEIYTKEKIEREVSMLYLFSGPCVKDDIETSYIYYIPDQVVKKNEQEDID